MSDKVVVQGPNTLDLSKLPPRLLVELAPHVPPAISDQPLAIFRDGELIEATELMLRFDRVVAAVRQSNLNDAVPCCVGRVSVSLDEPPAVARGRTDVVLTLDLRYGLTFAPQFPPFVLVLFRDPDAKQNVGFLRHVASHN